MKRILYVWDADYPWDIRTEKICNALLNAGFDVHIAARNLKKRPNYENINGLHVHRLNAYANSRVNYLLSFPVFISPIWKKFLDKVICGQKIDLVIVRDLPLAVAGIWAAKKCGLPVLFDMAENYVAMIRDVWEDSKFQGLNLIVRNPYLAKLVEKYAVRNFDHILVVVDEAVDVALSAGASREKISIVGNTPEQTFITQTSQNKDEDLIINTIKSRFSAIYTGGIQMGRGIQFVIEAIDQVIKEIPDFLFVVIGDGYAADHLKKMIKDRKVEDHVIWIGWVEHSLIYNYIKECKLGLIPHQVTEHVNTTIPNKIFDYMGCGIPLIASDATPMRRIINEARCGLTFRSGDVPDLVNAIIKLHNSSEPFGIRGKKCILDKYNWEADSKKLIETIRKYTAE